MSWGTDFTADLYLNRMKFSSKLHAEERLQEEIDLLESIRTKVAMFSSSNIRELVPSDWEEQPIDFIYNSVQELLDEYDEVSRLVFLLETYIENYE